MQFFQCMKGIIHYFLSAPMLPATRSVCTYAACHPACLHLRCLPPGLSAPMLPATRLSSPVLPATRYVFTCAAATQSDCTCAAATLRGGAGGGRVGAYDDHGDFPDDASVYSIRVPEHLLQLVDRRMCQRRVDKDGAAVKTFAPCERNAYVSHVSEVLGDILRRPEVDCGVGEGAVGGVQADVTPPPEAACRSADEHRCLGRLLCPQSLARRGTRPCRRHTA